MPRHWIADISYRRDRLVCACGLVMRAKDGLDWADHRREYVLTTLRERRRGKPLTVVGRR